MPRQFAVAAAAPNVAEEDAQHSARYLGVDALRGATTLLVVLHHTALTYGAIGGWYYRELSPDGSFQSLVLTLFCTINQAWFMGLFFLLAGYFTPLAVDRHGIAGFVRERLLRLGVPLLIYFVLIGPATVALVQSARGRDFTTVLLGQWRSMKLEPGPLWFVEAVLIFTAGYLCVRRFLFRRSAEFPTDRALLIAALVTGLGAFLIRLVYPVGVSIYALQLGYFSSYIALFFAGVIGARGQWLTSIPPDTAKRWRRIAWIAWPILPLAGLLTLRQLLPLGRSDGGWTVLAAMYAFWEPFVAWGVIMALLSSFQAWLSSPGELWRRLSRRAYLIYIVHPPILVGVALAWRTIAAPALFKFAATGITACVICYVTAGLLLRIPAIRRIA